MADIFNHIAKAMGCESPKQAIIVFREMMKDMELLKPEAENKEEELEVLSTSVNPVRLKNNPISLDEETIDALYHIILNGDAT